MAKNSGRSSTKTKSKTPPKTTLKSSSTKKRCSACQEEKSVKAFYASYNPLHGDQKVPMCKECIQTACYENGEFVFEKFLSVLRQIDRPFIQGCWDGANSEIQKLYVGKEVSYDVLVGKYFKNISMPKFRMMTWADSCFESPKLPNGQVESYIRNKAGTDKVYYLTNDEFEVTEDIIKLFGEGCTAQEYKLMWNYYNTMKDDYPNITESQKKLFLRYIRTAAREEIATNKGNTADAEKWGKLSSDALKQLNQSDLQGSISSFSEFFQKVERTKDVVRILPKYKFRPNDALDFIIWCFVNYCRRLEGKTECSYEDVYKFYDEKVAEYIHQYGDPYGIFTDDPTISNRENIKEFITLPSDYNQNDS